MRHRLRPPPRGSVAALPRRWSRGNRSAARPYTESQVLGGDLNAQRKGAFPNANGFDGLIDGCCEILLRFTNNIKGRWWMRQGLNL